LNINHYLFQLKKEKFMKRILIIAILAIAIGSCDTPQTTTGENIIRSEPEAE
jgi:hypothetical protein